MVFREAFTVEYHGKTRGNPPIGPHMHNVDQMHVPGILLWPPQSQSQDLEGRTITTVAYINPACYNIIRYNYTTVLIVIFHPLI